MSAGQQSVGTTTAQVFGREMPCWEEDSPVPFKELPLPAGIPHLQEPIKPRYTAGNYRLSEAQGREAADVQGAGGVLLADRSRHASLAAKEGGCRHQGPHKVAPEQAAFTGILGGA